MNKSCAVSTSKARRIREAATKRRMFSAMTKSEVDRDVKEDIASMISHVSELTAAVQSLLGIALPFFSAPWMGDYGTEGDVPGKYDATMAHQWSRDAANFQTHGSMEEIVQKVGLPVVSASCHEVGDSSYTKTFMLAYRHTVATQTLAGENAATSHLFTMDIHSVSCGDESSNSTPESDTGDYDISCTECGYFFANPLTGGEYDGDRCDKCAAAFCQSCLHIRHNLKGEWCLCTKCINTESTVVGDFRALPTSFWRDLHQKFNTKEPGDTASNTQPEPHNTALEELDGRLNYMVLFLEGHHAKSGLMTENVRTVVLQGVKRAMEWKSLPRSSSEINAKVEEMDHLMSAVVNKL